MCPPVSLAVFVGLERAIQSRRGLSVARGRGENGGKIQGMRSINGRYKIDRGRLGIVWAMEKPKNLHVRPMDMN